MDTAVPKLATLLRARLLQMMSVLERVGGTPIDTRSLHSFAFLTNVLSPLWDLEPLEGSVLKHSDGPYFPTLQRELDWLVGQGFINVVSLDRALSEAGEPRLDARFRVSEGRAAPVIEVLRSLPDELSMDGFLVELASEFLRIEHDRRDDAALLDAAYSDPAVSQGRIVDFAEWVSPTLNTPTWNAAQKFQSYMPKSITLSRAEKLVMYMRLLKRRAHG